MVRMEISVAHQVKDVFPVTLAQAARFGAVHCRVNSRVSLPRAQKVHAHPRHPHLPAGGDCAF
jgi:hypothetical protein